MVALEVMVVGYDFFFYSLSTSLHGLRVEKKKNTREIEFFGVAGMDDGMQNFYGIYK
jgi:hypothetical protein